MPYVLYTPSTATQNESIPLIVWLHGGGEVGVGSESFLNSGLLKVLNEWSLEGFNAYVLCPHLAWRWNFGNWRNQYAVNHLQQLLDTIIENYNIDINNIIIVGHSLGGDGAMYMACELPNYFSKLVVLSGYWSSPNLEKIVIPVRGYVGTVQYGEDYGSVYHMTHDFATIFGKENVFMVEASHGEVPKATFTEDKNNNNRSDIIEWMFDKLED